jgi:two-component system sensor histidine kinase and response regulator WspE
MTAQDLSQLSMIELFRVEAESQTQALTTSLLLLERNPHASDQLETCMRAAHSLKGAARIIDLTPGVELGHAMEECFVAAQDGRITLHQKQIDVLLHGVDLLLALARKSAAAAALPQPEITACLGALASVVTDTDTTAVLAAGCQALSDSPVRDTAQPASDRTDRMLRVTAETLNRLVGLAGEQLMEARHLKPFVARLHGLLRLHREVARALDQCRDALPQQVLNERAGEAMQLTQQRITRCQDALSQHLEDLDALDRRSTSLARGIYDEALACRMRPFEDGVRHYPRLVRDLGRSLGKQVRLELIGASTSVDRDILDRLDSPIVHMLRNAIDHGVETPEARATANKPAEGIIRLEARHVAGLLQIVVTDDGCGIDFNSLRADLVRRNLATEDVAMRLSDAEAAQFLFLPGFTMKGAVTAISGRGVGLDVVRTMVKEVRGIIRVTSQFGHFTRFQLELPLTLSVIRTALVQIDDEPYAFPLTSILRMVKLEASCIQTVEGLPYFAFEGQQIGLIATHQLLEGDESGLSGDEIAVVVVSNLENAYGLVVDRFLGERELVVVPLDARLGKIACVSAAALMEDGSPVLILDVEDLLNAAEKLAHLIHGFRLLG